MPPGSRCPHGPHQARTTASPAAPPSRYSNSGHLARARCDDEGQVAHDEAEPLAGHRVEHGTPACTSHAVSSSAALNRA